MHSRTRTPGAASSRTSASVRRSDACTTLPTNGSLDRSAVAIRSPASVVAWSSASTVTVVPASRAAMAIRSMWSLAIRSSSSRPTAVGFTDTSTAPPSVSPSAASLPSRCTYCVAVSAARRASVASSPR